MQVTEANITSIGRAIEYIEQNLQEEISMAQIADAACYSLYHFCRMFNSITHHTPYEYLMRRRLSEAARALVDTDKKIIEIAFEYEFNSPETFTRAFKRMFGMQPNQWRKQGKIPSRILTPSLTKAYLRRLNRDNALKPVLVEKQTFQVIGLMTLVQQDLSVVPALWSLLFQELEQTDYSDDSALYYGIVWYPEQWETCGFFYLAGWEYEVTKSEHPALVVKTLPAGHYARVLHKGPWQERHLSLEYLHHTWLPKSGKRLDLSLEIEVYRSNNRNFEQKDFDLLLPIKGDTDE